MKPSDYLNATDAAAVLGVSLARIKVFAKEGRLGTMVAGRYLFTRKELAAFAEIERPNGRPPAEPKPKGRKPKKKS